MDLNGLARDYTNIIKYLRLLEVVVLQHLHLNACLVTVLYLEPDLRQPLALGRILVLFKVN